MYTTDDLKPSPMVTEFLNNKDWGIKTSHFTSTIKRLTKTIRLPEGILNVIFVNDHYIQALNKKYRAIDKPTDVLSFSYIDELEEESDQLIGEVYVSVETAKKQAKEHKVNLDDELTKLIVHGILHVYGYDHEVDEDFKVMHGLERQVLGELADK